MEKVKVLSLPAEKFLSSIDYKTKDIPNALKSFFGAQDVPVFNRTGWYKTKEKAWVEFVDFEGNFVAFKTDIEYFNGAIEQANIIEKSINLEDWAMWRELIKKGIIERNRAFSNEEWRRSRRASKLKNMLALKQFEKIRDKMIEEAKGK